MKKENAGREIVKDGARVDLYTGSMAEKIQMRGGDVRYIDLRGFDGILYAVSEEETEKIRKGLGAEYTAVVAVTDTTGQHLSLRIKAVHSDGAGKVTVRGSNMQTTPFEVSCGPIPGKYRFSMTPDGMYAATGVPEKYLSKYYKFESKYKFSPMIVRFQKDDYLVNDIFFVVGGRGIFLLKNAGDKQKPSVKLKSGALQPVTLSSHLNIYPSEDIRVRDPLATHTCDSNRAE